MLPRGSLTESEMENTYLPYDRWFGGIDSAENFDGVGESDNGS